MQKERGEGRRKGEQKMKNEGTYINEEREGRKEGIREEIKQTLRKKGSNRKKEGMKGQQEMNEYGRREGRREVNKKSK